MTQPKNPDQRNNLPRVAGLFRSAFQSTPRFSLAWLGGQSLVLSVLHHFASFWEWNAARQIAAAVPLGFAVAFVLSTILTPHWKSLGSISRRRWIAFWIPAVIVAGLSSSQVFRAPETEHDLTITPLGRADEGEIRIREIRGAYGNLLDLGTFSAEAGWMLRDGTLIFTDAEAAPLHSQFRGPVGEQIRVSFLTSERGGVANVSLDGRAVHVDLLGENGNERRARLETRYRWGILDFAFLPFLAMIDTLAILAALLAAWTVHELGTRQAGASQPAAARGVHSHPMALILVCSVALLLHAWDFVAVPLRVTKDGPSYLQGAVYFAEHRNFDGAASYRGPGSTFLFAPALIALGRNPLGVKLSLHLLAIGCVPLAYAIGWQLTSRRRVAVACGLLTAFSHDLFAYANSVLSEVPHIFSLMLFGASLLYGLRHRSFKSALFCMLAGSIAVLVRPDNMAAFALGIVLLCLAAFLTPGSEQRALRAASRILRPIRSLAIAGAIAALPLLLWSAHNLRVHGFFGISDYLGAVLYDGWIYYGENSGIRIIDVESHAVREINAAIPILARDVERPTSWDVYQALLTDGYAGKDAFSLLAQASFDSIMRHPDRALDVLVLKFRNAPIPLPVLPISMAAGGNNDPYAALTRQYFDAEPWLLRSREKSEIWSRGILQMLYGPFYTGWLALGVIALWFSLYRKPVLIWLGYVALVANSLLLPILVGVASWRYLVPGIVLLGPIAIALLDAWARFAADHAWPSRAQISHQHA